MLSLFSCVQLFVTLWTVAHQASLSMGFSKPEYWSELPFPSPEDLPNPGIEPMSPALQADSLPTEQRGKPKEGSMCNSIQITKFILSKKVTHLRTLKVTYTHTHTHTHKCLN